jgi:hypothetical protein
MYACGVAVRGDRLARTRAVTVPVLALPNCAVRFTLTWNDTGALIATYAR